MADLAIPETGAPLHTDSPWVALSHPAQTGELTSMPTSAVLPTSMARRARPIRERTTSPSACADFVILAINAPIAARGAAFRPFLFVAGRLAQQAF